MILKKSDFGYPGIDVCPDPGHLISVVSYINQHPELLNKEVNHRCCTWGELLEYMKPDALFEWFVDPNDVRNEQCGQFYLYVDHLPKTRFQSLCLGLNIFGLVVDEVALVEKDDNDYLGEFFLRIGWY